MRAVLPLVLLVLAAGAWWYSDSPVASDAMAPPGMVSDAYMAEGLRMTRFTQAGTDVWYMTAAKAHGNKVQRHLQAPRMTGQGWVLDADEAVMPENGAEVRLSGAVVLRYDHPDRVVTMQAPEVRVLFVGDKIQGKHGVHMTFGKNKTLSADGFEVDMSRKRWHFDHPKLHWLP